MRRATCILSAFILAAAASRAASQSRCDSCATTRYWKVDRDYYRGRDTTSPPEAKRLDVTRKASLGIAFSGGGTRSASATIGELRGLQANGWLDSVRYVTAVSGGSWAAVPFTFYQGDDLYTLLGKGTALDPFTVQTVPNGLLAARVAASGLARYALAELPGLAPDSVGKYNLTAATNTFAKVRNLFGTVTGTGARDADRENKTYARTLSKIFLEGIVNGNKPVDSPYAWDFQTAGEIADSTGMSSTKFIYARNDRPFLIVGGTLVRSSAGEYPRLIPVEYTSLYTGIRQQYGPIGGTYVWPWAYDRLSVGQRSATSIAVGPLPFTRTFSLGDVIASSGAAPQLTLLLASGVPDQLRVAAAEAAKIFPSFTSLSIRRDLPTPPTEELPHGDGGFTDNFGLMPLLARRVKHIIVFMNSADPYAENDGLETYFRPIQSRAGDGDKTMNVVFDRSHYRDLIQAFDKATNAGGGALHCAAWKVVPNAYYNIQSYTPTICWVYNHAARNWNEKLPLEIQNWLKTGNVKYPSEQAKQLRHFPYYSTFEENKPRLIDLSTLQVNLLAHLGAWSVTNPVAVKTMRDAFGSILPEPKPPTP
jgi:hypothetical protein